MDDWKATPGKYPETLGQCFEQGRADFMAGYTLMWTPQLGPMTLNPKSRQRWQDGWMMQRDALIHQWEAEVNGLHDAVKDDGQGVD